MKFIYVQSVINELASKLNETLSDSEFADLVKAAMDKVSYQVLYKKGDCVLYRGCVYEIKDVRQSTYTCDYIYRDDINGGILRTSVYYSVKELDGGAVKIPPVPVVVPGYALTLEVRKPEPGEWFISSKTGRPILFHSGRVLYQEYNSLRWILYQVPMNDEWIRKFYPVEASKVKDTFEDKIGHCITKWTGAIPSNMKMYKLDELPITFDSSTCALCWGTNGFKDHSPKCSVCPITNMTGKTCDKNAGPTAMIQLLERTRHQWNLRSNVTVNSWLYDDEYGKPCQVTKVDGDEIVLWYENGDNRCITRRSLFESSRWTVIPHKPRIPDNYVFIDEVRIPRKGESYGYALYAPLVGVCDGDTSYDISMTYGGLFWIIKKIDDNVSVDEIRFFRDVVKWAGDVRNNPCTNKSRSELENLDMILERMPESLKVRFSK